MDSKKITVLILLLVGCAEPAVCVTNCGLRLVTKNTSWTCAELQHAENVALLQLVKVADVRFNTAAKICSAIHNWNIEVNTVPSWIEGQNPDTGKPQWVGGITYCEYGYFKVGPKTPLEGSFCHELAHVVQQCWVVNDSCLTDAGVPQDDSNHNCWTRDGEFAAAERCYDIALQENIDAGVK